MVEQVHRVTEVHETERPAATTSLFAARLIHFIFGVIIAFIVLRMVLLILGANQGNGFVDLIYSISGVFVAPFYGIFGTPVYGASIFDITSLLAIVVYALISWGLTALVTIGMRDRTEV